MVWLFFHVWFFRFFYFEEVGAVTRYGSVACKEAMRCSSALTSDALAGRLCGQVAPSRVRVPPTPFDDATRREMAEKRRGWRRDRLR